MKTYTKPSMMVLSISANDPLCLGCAVTTRNNPDVSNPLEISFGNYDGVPGFFSPEDADAAGLFGLNENCEAKTELYCKMMSASTLFTS